MEVLNTLSGGAWSINSDGNASFANVNVDGAVTINNHNVVTEDVVSSAIVSGEATMDNTYTVTFNNGVANGITSAKIPSYTSKGITDIESAYDGFLADANMINDILDYVDGSIADLVDGAPTTLDTLDEIAAALKDNADIVDALDTAIGNKVDKVSGKGLSTNDFTTTYKTKLDGIATGATAVTSTTVKDWGYATENWVDD